MAGKRKFCDTGTYRLHSDLKLLNQELSSDEDENLVPQDNEVAMVFREEQDHERQ